MSQILGKLDLNLLRVFDAIYTTRNISRAAAQIGVSQPAMSNALSRLRDAIGDPLFMREARGVRPTARAEDLVHSVRRILAEVDSIIAPDTTFDPATSVRDFRICIVDALESFLMRTLIKKATTGNGVRFQLLPSAGTKIDEALHSGAIDLAVNLPAPGHRDLKWEMLMPLDLVVVARKDHPVVQGSITAEQVLTLPQVSLDLDAGTMANANLLRLARRIELNRRVMVSRISSLLEIASTTDLIGITSRLHATEGPLADKVQVLDMPWTASEQKYHMTWHKRTHDDAAMHWLRDLILETTRTVVTPSQTAMLKSG